MILIIGAGLSGLLTAYRLQKEGIPFKILEARNRAGGRINTLYKTSSAPLEMGATWFQSSQKNVIALLEELSIEYFTQNVDATVYYQTSSTSPAQRVQLPNQSPSFRISGGTSHLVNTLLKKLNKEDVLLNQAVKNITYDKDVIKVSANKVFEATRVVLAIPPKLWSTNIQFKPQLPVELMTIAQQTHTWMEDSIKVGLRYERPFWEQENKPNTLYSTVGPVTEFYDHCDHKRSVYALCGFINSSFNNLSSEERKALVINQLTAVYGASATTFIDYEECVWSNEENTFAASDHFLYPHQHNGNPIFNQSFFNHTLFISGSESASQFPGYMDGAIGAANTIANKIIEMKKIPKS